MKKLLTMAIACCMALTLMLPLAYAADFADGPAMRRYEPCGNCDVGRKILGTPTYSSWKDITSVQCKKYQDRLDIVKERNVYTPVSCSHCSFRAQLTSTQRQTFCTH